jgi:hypothetical protein
MVIFTVYAASIALMVFGFALAIKKARSML